jgi:DMSO/TMAO reductase YedYZ molybdopterin-dependent catalytic subunit
MRELRSHAAVTVTVVTECAGNGRGRLHPPVPGEPWQEGAVSAAQWTGVPLRNVLELNDTAVEVVFTGADGGQFQRSLPREAAMDASTILAWEMNGAPIPDRFGGPVRLIVPGWYGMASVKWVARIEAVALPFAGYFQTERYVYAPGEPVTRLKIKSMLTDVSSPLRAGAPARLTGLAWGGDGVARVDLAVDGIWHPTRMVGPVLPQAWRRFELHWIPPAAGTYRLSSRATDVRGESQPDVPRWNPRGYGVNGVQTIEVQVA